MRTQGLELWPEVLLSRSGRELPGLSGSRLPRAPSRALTSCEPGVAPQRPSAEADSCPVILWFRSCSTEVATAAFGICRGD